MMVVGFVVVVYAFLAGFRTVLDPDLGWQMATGRWVVMHHQIPSDVILSYTALGKPWIYPLGSGLVFYATFLLGGFALLSWVGAAACAGTVGLLLRRGSIISAVMATFAIPTLAAKTTPRADLFTTVLFAAFLSLLWEQHETGRAKLWLLPPLMVVWVNLHLGFIAGLALLSAYGMVECLELVWTDRRKAAWDRLSKALPWLILTTPATAVNPWGWGIYRAIFRQQEVMAIHSLMVTEWFPYRLNWTGIESGLSLRSPDPFLVLLSVAALAIPIALGGKKLGAAVLISGAAYMAFQHVRLQALFCEVMLVVAAPVFSSALAPFRRRMESSRHKLIFAVGAAGFLLLLIIVRSADLVSNRTYMSITDFGSFGAGLSWWFPERAAAFIERENLPANIFNSFNEGGFFTWRLGMKYPDYVDGRNIPFGPELLDRNRTLMQTPPDDSEWQREADRYQINTILIPLARYYDFYSFPVLQQFCASETWRPVFLDEVSVIFLRRTRATKDLIDRLQIDCRTAPIPLVPPQTSDSVAFNQWSNAATVLHGLGRNPEAFEATIRALSIFQDSGYVHALRGSLLQRAGRFREAEQEYLLGVKLQPTGEAWALLAQLYHQDGRGVEGIHAWEHASDLLPDPTPALLYLGYEYLDVHQPQEALRFFDRAAAEIGRQNSGSDRSLLAFLAHGRAVTYGTLEDWNHAVQFQEEAVRLAPDRNADWLYLAGLYERLGRAGDAQAARGRAASHGGR